MNTEQNTQNEARDEDRLRGVLLAERNLSLWQRLLITFALMLVLILLVYHFNIPNPNMILIAGLVVCSSMFGFTHGTVSDEQELRSMFAEADKRMYEAKQRGPNTVVGD